MVAATPVAIASGAPAVRVMVVGRGGRHYLPPRTVHASSTTVRAGGKRCAVGAATPLAALVARRVAMRVRDYGGSCGRRASDSAALFVFQVGPDRNRGRQGWTYKVGTRSGTAGAADVGGPFGDGRLRGGDHVTWFWCRLALGAGCQRTLGLRPASHRVRAGHRLHVTVFGYDDNGRRIRVRGAHVTVAGGRGGRTDGRGVAVLRVGHRRGLVALNATRRGMVRAFPQRVRVT